MATKKTPAIEDDLLPTAADSEGLDQAIGDLRGVLKTDADGSLSDFGDFGDFGGDTNLSGNADLPDFGGDLSSNASGFGADDLDMGPSFTSGTSATTFGSGLSENLELIMDIPIDVQIVLGTSKMLVSGLMGLEEGAIIALDRKIGEPVEILVNGRCIGRGEITVLENDDTRFGVKLIEVMSTKKA